jgi:hypothetical protein
MLEFYGKLNGCHRTRLTSLIPNTTQLKEVISLGETKDLHNSVEAAASSRQAKKNSILAPEKQATSG